MKKILVLFISLLMINSTMAYESSAFKGVEFETKSVNVYNKGYRYSNRVFYKEKRAAKKLCAQRQEELFLELSDFSDIEFNLRDIGIRVSVGKRATIQFACDISFKAPNKIEITDEYYDDLDISECDSLEEKIKEELDSDLVFTVFSRKKCHVQIVEKIN